MKQNNYYLENSTCLVNTTEKTRGVNNSMIRNIKTKRAFIKDILPSLFQF